MMTEETPQRKRKWQKPMPGWIWIVVLAVMVIGWFVCGGVQAVSAFDAKAWLLLGVVVAAVALFVGFAIAKVWFATRWQRLANRPTALLAKGNAQGAQRAFEQARSLANELDIDDARRGILLSGMGAYLFNIGNVGEAVATHQECLEILRHHAETEPLAYMLALETHSGILMEVRDYRGAMAAMEKALDWIPVTRKGLGNILVLQHVEAELSVRMRLACLLVLMGALAEAKQQLNELPVLLKIYEGHRRLEFKEQIHACRALLECVEGNADDARRDCEEIKGSQDAWCLTVRAKVHLLCGEHRQAEELLRRRIALWWPAATQHHPGKIDPATDLADALFGQSKHDDAFASFEEARAIVADFALPADDAWRKALATWLQRAKDLGRTDLAASLEKELAQVSATPLQALTILEKFRIQPPPST